MIERIRAAAFDAFLWGSVVVYGGLLLLAAPLVPRPRLVAIGRLWGRSVLWALNRLCGIDHRVRGRCPPPGPGGQVLVSNHQSAWETIAIATILPGPQTWVVKRELLRIPFFGWALALFEPIAIQRADGRRAMRQLLETGAEHLERGHSVVIFPEGTRVSPDEHKRFGLGGALLATRAGAPVVPIAHNAGYFWPRRSLVKRPGTIDVMIGPAITSTGLSATALNAQLEQWVRATQASLPAPGSVQPLARPHSDAAREGSRG